VVDRAGEHAGELGLAQAPFEAVDLGFGVTDRRRVVLGNAQLEIVVRLGEIFVELLQRVELTLDVGALAQEGLSFGLVVPEVGSSGLFVQLGELAFELGDVKDAPLAPAGAA
jgi:hypothetical protein